MIYTGVSTRGPAQAAGDFQLDLHLGLRSKSDIKVMKKRPLSLAALALTEAISANSQLPR